MPDYGDDALCEEKLRRATNRLHELSEENTELKIKLREAVGLGEIAQTELKIVQDRLGVIENPDH